VPSLHIFYWHAANAMNFLIMKLHKAIMVPALSAAGDKAEFLYSAFAGVKMLPFNSS
jgi:hypothetical protein